MKFPELKELPTQELVDRLTDERNAALDRNEFFKAEIARLSNELVNALNERDALVVQVDQLRTEWEKKDGSDITESDKLELLVAIIYKTPAQCLTERDADAMEAAGKYLLSLITAPPSLHFTSADALHKRANQLRQQAGVQK